MVDAKVKGMMGILKETRKGFLAVKHPQAKPLPKLKPAKVKPIPGLGPKAGPKRAREALSVLLSHIITGVEKPKMGYYLDRAIEFVDFDELEKQTGIHIDIKGNCFSPIALVTQMRSGQYYDVKVSIANPKLVLGAALQALRDETAAREEDLRQRKKLALEAFERAQLAVAAELPVLVAAGMEFVDFPRLRIDNEIITHGAVTDYHLGN